MIDLTKTIDLSTTYHGLKLKNPLVSGKVVVLLSPAKPAK